MVERSLKSRVGVRVAGLKFFASKASSPGMFRYWLIMVELGR